MNNPVKIDDVSNERIAYYALWGGEVFVTAQQHIGAHGFFSAALVVERCDSPMECYMYDGYDTALRSKATGGTGGLTAHTVMKQWIASKLTELATGTGLAAGTHGTVDLAEANETVDGPAWNAALEYTLDH